MKFKTLQVGNTDLTGSRFNGQDLQIDLNRRGYDSHHLVWEKQGQNATTQELNFPFKNAITSSISALEKELSVQSLLYPSALALEQNEYFKASDLVHYHLLHTGWFSLLSLPTLTKKKPSVFTLHDPWAATGHCVYPRQCERWKTGCGSCPDLDVLWAIKKDNTNLMWKIKDHIYKNSRLDVIVASKFMQDFALQSPLLSRFDLHLVPFGIDLEKFKPINYAEKRRKLGIYPDNTVICLRASVSPFKGLEYVFEALEKLTTAKPLTILTFEARGQFSKYLGKHQLIDLGWVENQDDIVDAYQSSDLFLMPSTAEAFGVMAIEAMACAKPTIVFEGTSLSEVVFAPRGGISVPQGDSSALAVAMDNLIDNPELRHAIGAQARQLAIEHYSWNSHVNRVISVYEEVLAKPSA
ncbi:MAG: glycosyltransferase [Leptolyngbya sp.]|nr:glycosyltransferase [Candidatus Melainabacteria bacterium]